ncbi:MAG: hypothetical protein ABI462_05145 [Ignavibacteria bacterium]
MPICGYCGQQIISDRSKTGFQYAPVCSNGACPSNERCPKCNSKDLSIIYLLGRDLLFECRDCGDEWKKAL